MSDRAKMPVGYEDAGDVAILMIDYPPVNALGTAMRNGLMSGLMEALANPAVQAIVILGTKAVFISGADIRELGLAKSGASTADIQKVMENAEKPIIAAIEGVALGGGLEVALSAAYRVASLPAKFGFPEINLGLIPGGGGTQRATRLMGPIPALEMILSARQMTAADALAAGLIDAVFEDDFRGNAIAFARNMATGPAPTKADKITNTDFSYFETLRQKNIKKWHGMTAPFKAVDCVEAACRLPLPDGLAFEAKAFQDCMAAPSRLAQVHLFFAERKARKLAVTGATTSAPINKIAIVGAGLMGGGIAMALANAGLEVQLLDISPEALKRGMERIRATYQISLSRGSTTQSAVDLALSKIEGVSEYKAISEADLVIEAVFEDMALKQEIFRQLDSVTRPDAILGSNTSSMDIDAIAAVTARPGKVIGTHFFSPANVMQLLEIVRGRATSTATIETVMKLAKQIGKIPVLSGNCDGFIGNRILRVYGREADFLLEEGATPWQIDKALQQFGFPMGLFLMRDMAGLDIGWRIRQQKAGGRDPAMRYSPIADRICELGRFGQKSGAGYYRYNGREASPDPEIEKLIIATSAELGIARQPVTDEEIVTRLLTAIVNEGAWILEEGIARQASDIDLVYVYGYGFPKGRGGPMFWAEARGFEKIYRNITRYHKAHGDLWKPSPRLKELAASGKPWTSLEQTA